MTVTATLLAAARKHAKVCARSGKPISACPYDPNAGPEGAAAARAWMSVYVRWRPPTMRQISYDEDDEQQE